MAGPPPRAAAKPEPAAQQTVSFCELSDSAHTETASPPRTGTDAPRKKAAVPVCKPLAEPEARRPAEAAKSILRQLLPEGYDSGDLLVLLILLLLLCENKEESRSALLTMALFFFL